MSITCVCDGGRGIAPWGVAVEGGIMLVHTAVLVERSNICAAHTAYNPSGAALRHMAPRGSEVGQPWSKWIMKES